MSQIGKMTSKAKPQGRLFHQSRRAEGFSTLELIIATGLLTLVVGTVATLLHNVQKGYMVEEDVSEVQQNQRFGMDAILRHVRGAGNDPEGASFDKFDMDPNGDGQHNDLRVLSDFNPPDGDTSDPLEDVLFSLNGQVLTMQDADTGAVTELAQNIASVSYEYFDAAGNATTSPADAIRVRVTLNGISTHRDARTGQFRTSSLTDEGYIRGFQDINAAATANENGSTGAGAVTTTTVTTTTTTTTIPGNSNGNSNSNSNSNGNEGFE